MFGFLLRKNFYDGWDNLFSIVIVNLVFLAGLSGLIFLDAHCMTNTLLQLVSFVVTAVVLSILIFAYGDSAAKIANYEGIHLADYFKAIPGVLKDAVLFGLLVSAITVVSVIAVPYYLFELQTAWGAFIGALIVWMDVFVVLSLQWFVPLRSLLHDNFKKCLKKCFIIFFDNTGFSVVMAFLNLIMLVLSVVCLGFVPSVAGILIADTNALRLRLYKYDYLEQHPELTTKKERRKIPWDELIFDDVEQTGHRTFKQFIFPWRNED